MFTYAFNNTANVSKINVPNVWNKLHRVRSKSKDWKAKYFKALGIIKPKGLNCISKINFMWITDGGSFLLGPCIWLIYTLGNSNCKYARFFANITGKMLIIKHYQLYWRLPVKLDNSYLYLSLSCYIWIFPFIFTLSI